MRFFAIADEHGSMAFELLVRREEAGPLLEDGRRDDVELGATLRAQRGNLNADPAP